MLELRCDNRLYNNPRYYLAEEEDKKLMQAVSPEVKQCVVFICYITAGGIKLAGTGFFVSVEVSDGKKSFPYLVTAKHVIKGIEDSVGEEHGSVDGKVWIRINKKDGKVGTVQSSLGHWKYHKDSGVDLAILPWAPDQSIFDFKTIPVTMAVTDALIQEDSIGAGDEVFLTGLFSRHSGTEKNLPIIRTGNIAAMTEEKIYTKRLGEVDAYLIEARSIGGLSGSPVFVYLGHLRARKDGYHMGSNNRLMAWFGVMQGHWDTDEDNIDANVIGIEGKNVNMGIGIVVPATKVLDIINSEELMKERKKVIENAKKANAPTEDTITEITEQDFKNTLKKVSKKIKPSQPSQSKKKT